MSIVTFYSYKGGVGRSMALANIAVLLSRLGSKVLIVDWDLEAPGLERYFASHLNTGFGGPGLLDLVLNARRDSEVDYREFTSAIQLGDSEPICFLASGSDNKEYARRLAAFDWNNFFADGGGEFVEKLRNSWRSDFDIVLVDSRTGFSDIGGICTIQLPDIVVAMFTANFQSLYGVRDVIQLAQRARQSLAYDRMSLSVVPLASRWGMNEFQETEIWLDRVSDAVQEFCADWLPKTFAVRDVIERVRLPQADYFAFGEKLAVLEQGTANPQSLGFVYEKVARFLASDLQDVEALLGPAPIEAANGLHRRDLSLLYRLDREHDENEDRRSVSQDEFSYDIFISHDRASQEFSLEFAESLKAELNFQLDRPARIFLDVRELRSGELGLENSLDAVFSSKVMLVLVTSKYSSSEFASMEAELFLKAAKAAPLILPVLISGDPPRWLSEFQAVDFREARGKSIRSSEWLRRVRQVASRLGLMILEAEASGQRPRMRQRKQGEGNEAADELRDLADRFLSDHSRHQEVESLYRRSIEISEMSGDRLGEAHALRGLADLLSRDRSRRQEAESLYQRSIEISEMSGDRSGHLQALRGLAELLSSDRSRRQEAESLYQRSIEISEISGDRSGHLQALRGLAELLSSDRSRRQEAESLYQRSIEISEMSGDRSGHLQALRGLAELLSRDRSRQRAAESLYQRSIEISEISGDRSGQLQALRGLAELLSRDRSRQREAESLYRRSIEISEISKDQSGQLQAMRSLAEMLSRDRGRHKEAESLYRRSIEISETLGDRLGQLQAMRNLAEMLSRDRGRHKEAESLYRRSIEISEMLSDRPSELQSLRGLADLLSRERGH